MNNDILILFSSSITGNIVGIISLLIGIVSLIITIRTLKSARRIEYEIKNEKVRAINKSKFNKSRENILKKLNQKRNAVIKQRKISFNLCMELLSYTNDLLAYETVFEASDYEKILLCKEELNQLIEVIKNDRGDVSIFSKFDEVVARMINILEKGEYDI